jgi:hypothetical protein
VPAEYADQARFILDDSKDIAVLGTRRSGKTHGTAARLYRAARKHKRSIALYIALTRDSAKSIMWPVLQELNEKHRIGAQFTENDLTVHLANGSIIKLVGADMKNFMNRLRGAKYSEVAIDELQSFRSHLEPMIDEILKPALIDYNGALTVCGTPGPIMDGYFYNITELNHGNYAQHRLSMVRNPFLPNAEEWLKKHIEKMGWDENHPTLLREYRGQWVTDQSSLVYGFNKQRNVEKNADSLDRPIFVMGLDLGFNDKCAISVIGYSETQRKAYIVFSDGYSGMDVTEIAEFCRRIIERYQPVVVECDTGGLGKTIAAELIIRHGLPIRAAEKVDKLSWIALMNDDFRNQRLVVTESCDKLIDQYLTLTKDDKGREDPRLPNDLCDSALYPYRRVFSFLSKPLPERPDYGTEKWANEEARRMEEEAARRFQENQEGTNFDY